MEIGDGDEFESFLLQVSHQLFDRGKAFAIYGEGPIVLLIVDIEIDDVGRNLAFAELSGDLFYLRLRVIAVTALLVPEREEWRQGSPSDELCKLFNYVLGVGSVEKVIVECAAVRSEGI